MSITAILFCLLPVYFVVGMVRNCRYFIPATVIYTIANALSWAL